MQKNYHVILGEDWHQYSVPHEYIGKQVKIIYDTVEVEIYLGLKTDRHPPAQLSASWLYNTPGTYAGKTPDAIWKCVDGMQITL